MRLLKNSAHGLLLGPSDGLPVACLLMSMTICVWHNIPQEVVPHMPRMRINTAPEAAICLQALLKPACTLLSALAFLLGRK